jgi:hypothetical protein
MPVELKCQTCGKLFKVQLYRAQTAKYCSRKCRNTQIEKICERCGKQFKVEAHRKNAKYCSNTCKYPKQIEKKCLYCGKTFKVKNYRKDDANYCSRKCNYKDRKNYPSPKRNRLKKTCKRCGKEFEVIPSQTEGTKYCSWECRFPESLATCQTCGKKFRIKPSVIKKGHALFCSNECKYPPKVETTCLNCGKKFETHPHRIREGIKFCSRKCQNKFSIGKNASGWKGGISFEPYCPKFNNQFKERVRTFWGRKCGICGILENNTKRKLLVHHVNYEKMVCCNDIPPLFMALCHSCHSKTNSNRNQWESILTAYIMIYYDGNSYLSE